MILETLTEFIGTTGFLNMDYKSGIMIVVALIFLVLAIRFGFEPLLLVPIAFGMLLSNLPLSGMFSEGGLFYWFYQLNKMGILPPLIFHGCWCND
jgi:carboxybiotin decarboxylase